MEHGRVHRPFVNEQDGHGPGVDHGKAGWPVQPGVDAGVLLVGAVIAPWSSRAPAGSGSRRRVRWCFSLQQETNGPVPTTSFHGSL